MPEANVIQEHMEVLGSDGVHVGTVDGVENHRIKLTKQDSGDGTQAGRHQYISTALVQDIKGNVVTLTATAEAAIAAEEEEA